MSQTPNPNDFKDVLMDLWPLFVFSCGIAFFFRRRVKQSYKGRSKLSRCFNDILSAICTGSLSVFAAVVLSIVWPQLEDLKMQICMCGLLSGYGMNVINRLMMEKLGISKVDLDDYEDIKEAKRQKRLNEK